MTTRLEHELEEMAIETVTHRNGEAVVDHVALNTVPSTTETMLNPIEAAYVVMAESEFRAAQLNAQQLFNSRLSVVWTQKHVPDNARVTILRSPTGEPTGLSWGSVNGSVSGVP